MDEVTHQAHFLQDLRSQTAPSHTTLEQHPVSKRILDDRVTLHDYQIYLSRMYGIVRACETQVYPVLDRFLNDLKVRKKSQLIADDLQATGMSAADIARIPVYDFQHPDLPQAIGIMYVLEGSTLGGRILFKHTNNILGLTETHGASYFAGYGPQTGSMWSGFLQALTREILNGTDQQKIIDASVETFDLINTWLSGAEDIYTHENQGNTKQ